MLMLEDMRATLACERVNTSRGFAPTQVGVRGAAEEHRLHGGGVVLVDAHHIVDEKTSCCATTGLPRSGEPAWYHDSVQANRHLAFTSLGGMVGWATCWIPRAARARAEQRVKGEEGRGLYPSVVAGRIPKLTFGRSLAEMAVAEHATLQLYALHLSRLRASSLRDQSMPASLVYHIGPLEHGSPDKTPASILYILACTGSVAQLERDCSKTVSFHWHIRAEKKNNFA
eukprot:3933981-Amphidinium_carterae.1